MSKLIGAFQDAALQRLRETAQIDERDGLVFMVLGWRLDDGAEVLQVSYVDGRCEAHGVEPDGRAFRGTVRRTETTNQAVTRLRRTAVTA